MMQASGADPFTAYDLLIYVGLPVVGALLGHLWTRYRRRLVTLRWTAQSQPLAFATEDFGWGKVEIFYNEKPAVGHLHMLNVQITNESQTDLANVELTFVLSEGTMLYRSAAQVRGAVDSLPFAPEYAHLLTEAGTRTLTPQEVAVWMRRTGFLVPVLNRGGTVDARLLVARTDYAPPVVAVHCNHLGLKVKHEPPAQQFWGVNQNRAAWLGVLVGLTVVAATVRTGSASWLGALVPWFAGAAGILLGALITRAWRWLSRMAG